MLGNIAIGWFLGFVFGIGCSLVVLYAIYQGGYRRAIDDSMLEPQPARYLQQRSRAEAARIRSGDGDLRR